MEYRRFDNTIVARIDRGEEVLEQVAAIAQAEQIKLASVQALGAVGEFTVGVFHTAEKQYHANSFAGDFEIVSLTGTINTMDGAFYTHLHMSAGNEKGEPLPALLGIAAVPEDTPSAAGFQPALAVDFYVDDQLTGDRGQRCWTW